MKAQHIVGSLGVLMASCMGINTQAAEIVQSILPVSSTGHDRFYAVSFDASGSYYAVGSVSEGTQAADDSKTLIAKFLPDGSLDASFGVNGYAIHNLVAAGNGEVARSITLDSSGRVLVGGLFEHAGATDARDRDAFVIRLKSDGSLDLSYGLEGLVSLDFSTGVANGQSFVADSFGGFAIDKDDRLIVEGAQKRGDGFDTDFVVTRLTRDGAVDVSFGTEGKFSIDNKNLSASAKNPILLADGSIIATGYNRDGVNVPFLFKLNADGILDTSYGVNGIFQDRVLQSMTEVYAGILQGTDVVTVGYGKNEETESLDFLSLRINAEGKLDESYGTAGYVRGDVDGFNDNGRFLAALPDGRVALVGGGRYSSVNVDGMVLVLNEDGSADQNFAENGIQLFDFGGENDFLWGAAVSPAGDRLVTVGIKSVTNGNDDAALVVIPLTPKVSPR